MPRGRKATPVAVSVERVSIFELDRARERVKDDTDVIYSGRAPGSTSSTGLGFIEGLDFAGGDVLYARSTSYDGMDKYFREYKRDSCVRAAIDVKAEWVTKEGYVTELDVVNPAIPQPLEPYRDVKDFIDNLNRKMNFDHILRSAVMFTQISGIAGYLILRGDKGFPSRLVELEPWALTPYSKKDGSLDYWRYSGTRLQVEDPELGKGMLKPDNVLHFTNNELLEEHVGLSEVEPVIDTLESRRYLLREAIKECAKSLWAPAGILKFDTGRRDATAAGNVIKNIIDKTVLAPGKFIGVNQDVEFLKLDISPDLRGLIVAKHSLDNEIIASFQVPSQLLNRGRGLEGGLSIGSTEAEVAVKMFIQGPIGDIQKQLARQVEARWYTPLINLFLRDQGRLGPEEEAPVKLKHIWNKIEVSYVRQPEAGGFMGASVQDVKKEVWFEVLRQLREVE